MERENTCSTGIQITLQCTTGNQKSIVQVDYFPFIIGRDSTSVQLALPDATVSRVHARLNCQDGVILLENISTTNRTAVNGKVINAPTEIHNGDRVVMGSSQLVFEIERLTEEVHGAGNISLKEESKTDSIIVSQILTEGSHTGKPGHRFPPKSTKPQILDKENVVLAISIFVIAFGLIVLFFFLKQL